MTVSGLQSLSLIVVLVLASFSSGFADSNAYYVDPGGNDANSGRVPADAWKTLQRVNRHKFAPSDRVLFKRGGEWKGQLLISGQGTVEGPIVIGAFGEGAAPRIYNTYDLTFSGKAGRYSTVFESGDPGRLSRILRCRPGFIYKLKLLVRTEAAVSIGLQLSANGNLYLQNEQIKGVPGKWEHHNGWIEIKKSLSGLQEIPLVFQSPSGAMKTVQFKVKNASGKGRVQVLAVQLEPRWTPHPDYKNVFMLDTDLKLTELIYEGRRLSRLDNIERLEDQTYFFRDGVWYLKDMKGNPEESGVGIQAVTSAQNAVLLNKSKYVILEGLDIRGGTGVNGYLGALGVYDSDHIEVRNCTVSNSTNAAIMVSRSEHIRISKCDVSCGGLGGIYLGSSKDSIITGNDTHHNGHCLHDLNDLHGIAVAESRRVTIEYNHVHHNGYGGGSGDKGDSAVTLYSGSDCMVRYNLIDHNWRGGITVDSGHEGNSDHTVVQNNILADNGLLGPGGRYPALGIQAHPPSTSDYVLVANNTIVRHKTGDVWSLAAQKPQAASAGDGFKGRSCRGTVVFWKGAYLVAAISGILNEDDVMESMDGSWKTRVLRINSAPAAIVLMSPMAAVKGVLLKGNIVADTEGPYDLSMGRDFTSDFAGNCFRGKGGSVLFKENDLSHAFFRNNERGFLFRDPGFKDDRTPEGLVPADGGCKESGAQPQIWLDKAKR